MFTLLKVWDTMIIESAMKTFYNKDIDEMIQSIQSNITVRFIRILLLRL